MSETATPDVDQAEAPPPRAAHAISPDFRMLAVAELREAKLNPRQTYDQEKLAELTASIKAHGVRTPLLVRPLKGKVPGFYEIGAGHRRYRAAKAAGLELVPAVVQEMTDPEFLELLTFENLQREDVHPLEEAEGYRQLLNSKGGYDVARIAERVGKSVKYVYDRMKLLSLTRAAQDEFRAGHITAGHAILLARLKPDDQERVMDQDEGGLWECERNIPWRPEDDKDEEDLKPVSVRELQGWIDRNVRFDDQAVEPVLFPETAQVLTEAREEAEKVVHITHEHHVLPEAKQDGKRTYGPQSWKRADGRAGSKECQESVTGVIVVGAGRGEAFKVCIDKEHCATHWGKEQREKKARQVAATKGGKTGEDRWAIQRRKDEERQKREQAEQARWKKAVPAILKAVAERVNKAPAGAASSLADILVKAVTPSYGGLPDAARHVPRGKTAEDLVRHAAFVLLCREAVAWDARSHFPKRAKAFGINAGNILDQAAPIVKDAPPAKPKRPAKAKRAAKRKAA